MRRIFGPGASLVAAALLAGCGGAATQAAPAAAEPPTPTPEPWRVVLTSQTEMLTTLGAFYDPKIGVTIGDDRQVHYSADAGAGWTKSKISSTGLYGLDFLDASTVWTCGYRNVRISDDGGATWREAADFGGNMPEHCRYLSLADADHAWAATQTQLGVTTDGAASWTITALPDNAGLIAAIDRVGPGRGYLLDDAGTLFRTGDDAATWNKIGSLPLDGKKIPAVNTASAAMGWRDDSHGLVIVAAIRDGAAGVTAYLTSDGGQTWQAEVLGVPYGSPVVSQGGRYVSIFTQPNKLTLLEFVVE
jgi:photosystem II stability/assembly factor-like uncharacterized protein